MRREGETERSGGKGGGEGRIRKRGSRREVEGGEAKPNQAMQVWFSVKSTILFPWSCWWKLTYT